MNTIKQHKAIAALFLAAGFLNIFSAYFNFADKTFRTKPSFIPFAGLILLALGIAKIWRIRQLSKEV